MPCPDVAVKSSQKDTTWPNLKAAWLLHLEEFYINEIAGIGYSHAKVGSPCLDYCARFARITAEIC